MQSIYFFENYDIIIVCRITLETGACTIFFYNEVHHPQPGRNEVLLYNLECFRSSFVMYWLPNILDFRGYEIKKKMGEETIIRPSSNNS